ncbi:hypothetical protein [Campylobacter sp. 19-13652]|uniref:hypothetical protein n=1 Tax=Campylobacter sp. 19-13652 TaxID=2840180 RepID=UPI001C791421|nr:hypothetical protein [Campylobacter sp. 19-13652]BCX79260.1 hypothetical protein LBC_07220 [Campylobacter sp. 19-13652]
MMSFVLNVLAVVVGLGLFYALPLLFGLICFVCILGSVLINECVRILNLKAEK